MGLAFYNSVTHVYFGKSCYMRLKYRPNFSQDKSELKHIGTFVYRSLKPIHSMQIQNARKSLEQ